MYGAAPSVIVAPYREACIVLCDPNSDTKPCGKGAGEHTVLGRPICDECYDAVQLVTSQPPRVAHEESA